MIFLRLVILEFVLAVIMPRINRLRYLIEVAPGAAGFAAKQLCTLVYGCGMVPDVAQVRYVDKLMASMNIPLDIRYQPGRQRVTASINGIWRATAEMRPGLGATLVPGNLNQLPAVTLPSVQDVPLCRATAVDFANGISVGEIEDALEQAFAPEYDTLAVAVLQGGKLVAERYAAGIDSSTPLPGWSMAKSVTATLAGVLVQQGRLDIDAPGVVPEWCDHPEGAVVTLDHLLRMISGLDVVEDQSGRDPNSRMLFVEPDMAAYAVGRGIKATPGTHWEYMSGSTLLASRAIVQAAGGTLEASQRYFRQALFQPLGAASFMLEPDAAGTFIGSSYAIASTHDWAKFGQLYLENGRWQGQQILPDWWRAYVTSHTPPSESNSYGAGFWTVEHSNLDTLPGDTFYANGFQGQYVIVIPSRSVVIVRLGASHGPTGIWEFVERVLRAIPVGLVGEKRVPGQ